MISKMLVPSDGSKTAQRAAGYKVLIYDERSDALDFLFENIVNHGYKAGIAKNGTEIINLLSI